MLKIVHKPRFDMDVAINTKQVQGTLGTTFVAYRTSELAAEERRAKAANENVDLAVLRMVVASFEDTPLPDGTLLRYEGPDSVNRLVDWPGVAPAMLAHFYDGLWSQTLGNSEPLPAGTGPATAAAAPTSVPSGPTP